jgi:hypothetical protein
VAGCSLISLLDFQLLTRSVRSRSSLASGPGQGTHVLQLAMVAHEEADEHAVMEPNKVVA